MRQPVFAPASWTMCVQDTDVRFPAAGAVLVATSRCWEAYLGRRFDLGVAGKTTMRDAASAAFAAATPADEASLTRTGAAVAGVVGKALVADVYGERDESSVFLQVLAGVVLRDAVVAVEAAFFGVADHFERAANGCPFAEVFRLSEDHKVEGVAGLESILVGDVEAPAAADCKLGFLHVLCSRVACQAQIGLPSSDVREAFR